MHKYDKTNKIYDGYGLLIFNLSDFNSGEEIYITFNTYNGIYRKYLSYSFVNYLPSSEY